MNKIEELLPTEVRPETCPKHGSYESRKLFFGIFSGCPQCAADEKAIAQREAEERAAVERFRVWRLRLGTACYTRPILR